MTYECSITVSLGGVNLPQLLEQSGIKMKEALRQRAGCGEVNAIAVLQKIMHSLRMDLTTEGQCLKGSHSPTIEGD